MVRLEKKFLMFICPALIVVFLDQLTKLLIQKKGSINIIGDFFKLELSKNYGAGFSLLQGQTALLIWFSVFAIGLIIYYYDKIPEKIIIYPSLVLGGAVGNLIDRVGFGYVVDFIDLNIWKGYVMNIYFKIWPAFNLADLAVFIGVIGLVLYFWKK